MLQGMDALRKFPGWMALMLLLLAPQSVLAAEVAFVSHTLMPSVEQLARKTEALSGIRSLVFPSDADVNWSSFDACVVIGPQTLENWPGCGGKPVIAVFVTREAAAALKAVTTSLYLEPPLSRQVGLARIILGDDRPLGVLVRDRAQWKTAGGRPDPLVTPYFTDQYPTLNHALLALLRSNHALIGIYDTELYSSENIKNILITAYRQNKPLIGPSSAYIKAGALATTYSDLDDVARRLSEILLTGLKEQIWPQPDYNPYFKVRYNPQVGRSLNLLLPDENAMAAELAAQEKRQ